MTFKKTLFLACSFVLSISLLTACVEGQAVAVASSTKQEISSQPEPSSTPSSTSTNKPEMASTSTESESDSQSDNSASTGRVNDDTGNSPGIAPNKPTAENSQPTETPAQAQQQPPAPQSAPEQQPCPEPIPQPEPAPEPSPPPPPAPAVDAGACIAEARAYALGKGLTENGGLNTGNAGYLNAPDITVLSQASVISDLKYCIDVYASYSPDDPSLVQFNVVQSGNLIFVLYC